MRGARVGRAALACATTVLGAFACTPKPPAVAATPLHVPTAAPPGGATSAGPPAPPPPPPVIRVTYFGDEGAYLGPFYEAQPEAAHLVEPCVVRTRDEGGPTQGFLLLDIRLAHGAAARVTLRESSPLPASLVACVSAALTALRPRDPTFVPPPLIVYISLR